MEEEQRETVPILTRKRDSKVSDKTHTSAAEPQLSKAEKMRNVRLTCLIIVLCVYSTLHTARIICSPVILTYLSETYLNSSIRQTEISWVGQLYEMLSFFLVPLFCGIIDKFGIGYRLVLLISIGLQLIGNISTALAQSLDQLPVTYSFLPGIASALAIGTIILMADEFVGENSKYRILATTYCQGAFSATFFFSYIWAMTLFYLGWTVMNLIISAVFIIIGIISIILIPEERIPWRPRRPENLEPSEKATHLQKPLSEILLGLSSFDTVSSPTLLIWLLYRLLQTINKIGVYVDMAKDISLSNDTFTAMELYGLHYPTLKVISCYLFSAGEILTFFLGAVMGYKIRGSLNHVYAISSVFQFFFFILLFLISFIHPISTITGFIIKVTFFLSGCMTGLQNTFTFAASEEATLIPARRVYPFTLIVTGVAFIISPILNLGLSYSKQSSLEFLVYGIFALVNSGLILYILYKNYNFKAMLKRRKSSNVRLRINATGSAINFG